MSDGAVRTPLRRLTDVSRALTYARSLDEVLELTVACAADLVGADRAVLMLDDEQDGLLRIAAGRGIAQDQMARFREPLDENLLDRLAGVLALEDRSAFVGVPLVVRGGVIGLLGVRRPSGAAPSADDEWLLSAIADQAAVAIESARDQAAREELADRIGRVERERIGQDHALKVLSHDLRTPVNAIQGYASLLAAGILGPLNERQADAVQRMRSVVRHLESLLDNVLEMARLTAGRIEVHREPVDLSVSVEEALEIVGLVAERAAIGLVRGDSEGVRVSADPARVRQVLVQLLDNAVKYSPDGSAVRVDVRRARDRDREWGVLAVTDSGPGIPAALRERIFEPYLRSDGETPRSRTGAGLGLALARGLTEQMDGRLRLDSEVGRGSTFSIWLPVAAED